jgi:proprotein convertase subtilisin/kexin type 5
VTACSSSYYADVTTNSCVSCNLTICLTCIQNGNNCLTCNTNYYYYQTGCLKQCPNQTYADVVIGKCSNCPFPCSTCSNYTYCLTCLTTYYLFSNRCFSQCPIGYYSDNLSVCRLCGVNCQICTSSICLECTSGYFILNNSCLTTCPLRYYTGV